MKSYTSSWKELPTKHKEVKLNFMAVIVFDIYSFIKIMTKLWHSPAFV